MRVIPTPRTTIKSPRLTAAQPARIVPFASPPPDAADEDFADGSVEMNADGSQFRVAPALLVGLQQSLTTTRTVYVDKLLGNDSGDGSAIAPFQTPERALLERARYAVSNCLFIIQFIGAGPYLMPGVVGGWTSIGTGCTVFRGDVAVRTIHATGTATADFTGSLPILPTSAGMGSDTHKGRFLRFTSGACAGLIMQVVENTDTSITVSDRIGRNMVGAAVAAGDGFQIFSPGTELSGTCVYTGVDTVNAMTTTCALVLENVVCTGLAYFSRCAVTLLGCKMASTWALENALAYTAVTDASALGLPANAYRGCGVWAAGAVQFYAGYGTISMVASGAVFMNGRTEVFMSTGRLQSTLTLSHASFLAIGPHSGAAQRCRATRTCARPAEQLTTFPSSRSPAATACASNSARLRRSI